MLNMDSSAGEPSGPSPTPDSENRSPEQGAGGGTFELPAKLRVHALAKLLGSTSREIITTLNSLGESARSAQSNITREVALKVVQSLRPEQVEENGPIEEQPASDAVVVEEPSGAQDRAPQPEAATGDSATVEPAEASQDSAPTAAGLSPVFAAPQAMFLAPEPAQAEPAKSAPAEPEQPEQSDSGKSAQKEGDKQSEQAEETDEESDASGRRRRRRGRRGRGRGRGGEGDTETTTEQESEVAGGGEKQKKSDASGGKKSKAEPAERASDEQTSDEQAPSESAQETSDSDGESQEGSRRRRRRRRRKGTGDEDSNTRDDDPPNTVVHVRESAPENGRTEPSSDDEVRAIKGSTRLEAKRQRRRDGREAGRRRAPVLSEAEFLARRESVDRKMVVRENGDQTQIAVLEDNVLVENFVTSSGTDSLVGNVYLGRVQNVLPSMEAAFVDIGRGRNAVLYAGEVDWDAAGLAGKARRIEQALSTGDSVLVQVTKDPMGHKGARLTTQISLPGRFLVYVPGGSATGISRKLPDNERKRLKDILKRIVPDNAGVIIRTASEGTSEEALDRDVKRLQAQWEVIKEKAEVPKAQAPQLLYEEPDLLIKVVRDLFTEDFSAMTVQGGNAWETIEAYVQHVAPDLLERLHKHVGKNDVFTEQRISEQISKALDRKVWLPSGGYLIIDRTEAMTVIDVNTGKYTGSGGNLEETVTRNNLEAADEIVRQLRLRDIGGIIVIDFIDMVLESNRDLVLRRLTECLGRDRTRHQVAEVTSLGLVQMTRKRVGTGLLEAYSSTCEHCRGRGVLVSTDSVTHVHNNQSGNNGGQSRRNRNKGGKQDGSGSQADTSGERSERTSSGDEDKQAASELAKTPAPATAEAAKVVESEPAASADAGSKDKPAKDKSADSKAAQDKSADAKAQPKQVEKPKTAGQESKPQPAAEPTAPEAESNGRPKRRKVSRPAGSASVPATPVVLAPSSSEGSDAERESNGTSQVLPPAVAPAARRSRRSVSRPSGPPVESEPDAAAGASAES